MAFHPFRHMGLKIVAVALSVLLWLTVSSQQIVERSLRVPLELQNVPSAFEIIGDPPSTADVRVRGASGVLSRIEPGDVVAVLDLGSARPGFRLFHLMPEHVKVPFGVAVSQVSPTTIPLEIERSGSRVVPIVPALEGEPAPGYEVAQVTTEPAHVEVTGPVSRLGSLTRATTEPVSVADASDSVNDDVTVGLAEPGLRLKEPLTARVTVQIRPASVLRTITGVPVRIRNLAHQLAAELQPAEVTVQVRGSQAVLKAIGPETVTAFVDLAGLRTGRYNLQVRVQPGHQFSVLEVEPSSVEVRIR